eukprot:jgi/Picsp_1/3991/NSC_01503-R1_---NA---
MKGRKSLINNIQVTRKTKRAILISTQRSGSTWLASSLNSANSRFASELMINYSYLSKSDTAQITWDKYKVDFENSFARVCDEGEVFGSAHAIDNSPVDCGQASMLGFKLMYDQIPMHLRKSFFSFIGQEEITMIHLIREATLLKIFSRLENSGPPHLLDKKMTDIRNDPNLAINVSRKLSQSLFLIKELEDEVIYFSTELSVFAKNFVQVLYEDLTGTSGELFLKNLYNRLELDYTSRFRSNLKKIHHVGCDQALPGWEHHTEIIGKLTEAACYKIRNVRKSN